MVQQLDVLQRSGLVRSEKMGPRRRLDRLGAVLDDTRRREPMSVIHADFSIERCHGCSPPETFSAFAEPERIVYAYDPLRDHRLLERLLAGEPVR